VDQWIVDFTNNYGALIYLVILVWTFLEGETIVLITGAMISGGNVHLSVWTLVLFAFLGSFGGDQMWFSIGRTYGTPLLARWPKMASRVDWAFRLMRKQEDLFILSFRFIYGVRNVSPFIIGMSGTSRIKFIVLNLIAAFVWANTFAWGGYFLGKALDNYLGRSSEVFLGLVILGAVLTTLVKWLHGRRRHNVGIPASPESRS